MSHDYFFDPDDKLDRFGYAKFLRFLIENCDQYKRDESSEAYSIAIDSSWGTGKTYFFKMFENYLYGKKSESNPVPESNPEFIVVNYNAWSNDYWDDAFAPFMQAILDNDRFMGTDSKSKLRRILESIIQTSDSTPAKIYTNYRSNSPLVQLRQKQQSMQDLKDCLSKMILDCKSRGLKKLVIIIDELDRCKPLFAIQTLEIVKHFLDVKDVVFIFAVDLEQLSHSIESVYGSGIDASGYLCKFFDYITKFPKVSEEFFASQFIDKLTCQAFSSDRNKTVFSLFFSDVCNHFTLSLRDIETVLQNYKIMLESFLSEYVVIGAHKLYLFLLVLKYKDPEDFSAIFYNTTESVSQIIDNFLRKYRDLQNIINLIRSHCFTPIYINGKQITLSSLCYDSETHTLTAQESNSPHITIHTTIASNFSSEYLFSPDLSNEDNLNYLKTLSYSEYVLRHLENFNFSEFAQNTEQ